MTDFRLLFGRLVLPFDCGGVIYTRELPLAANRATYIILRIYNTRSSTWQSNTRYIDNHVGLLPAKWPGL